ncbi:CLUMA_CG009915, isoform A [Clunio marinus]|uniref:CLUMA_CG009915, isoform A n=1 Tax=Clunio marinus TaxID=568069 RepID=A0A1J1I9C3_9DIPT|nr:CLUMA_CG009915, isoform A [Clunio marinus]
MSNRSKSQDFRNIYELLDKLCKNFSPDRHKEILRTVTSTIKQSQQGSQGFISNQQYDEAIVVAKIKNHLSTKSGANLSVFLNLHEQLSTLTDKNFRTSILTLLLYLSDMESKLPNASKHDYNSEFADSVFTLPIRNRQVEASASMEHIFQGINSRNVSNTTVNSENNLKLVTYRRNLPSSTSSDSVLYGQSPDPELTFNYSKNEDLVQEAIYSMTGKSGKFLKKDVTGEFKLDIKARNLSAQEGISLIRIAEIGRLHNDIQKFTDSNSEFFLCGLFGQGLISQVETELVQFYGLIAHLQDNLHSQQVVAYTTTKNDPLTLVKVFSILNEPLKRMRSIGEILQSCKNLKGGPLSSALYEHLFNGNSIHKSLAESFLKATCRPLQNMLSHWLLDGEIVDPHHEFFIEEIKEVSSDRLWHHKYRVVNARLPLFVSKTLARKILVSGKSINFLREVCEDRSPIKGREELKLAFENNVEDLYAPVQDSKLHVMIDQVYLNTSKKVLDIALGQYRLLEHLQSMRKYLLLGQGDFINLLMEKLKDELDRPAKELYQHALFSIVASSVRATSQFDDGEILEHLDVKLVHAVDGDRGWDIFTLQYTVHGPLSTILELNMGKYQELFKPLWKAKHTEFVLDNIWKNQMLNSKRMGNNFSELSSVTYRLQAYTSEMIHFIHQMQYYILFEVIECSWVTFIKRVQSAKALDDILEAHQQFLSAVRVGIFLDNETKHTLYLHLDIIYDSIMNLEDWQKTFYQEIFQELEEREAFEKAIKESEKKGVYGVTSEKRLERDEHQKNFEQTIGSMKKSLDGIGNNYEKYLNDFLLLLTSSKDQNLQRFGIRLDFNEFYKRRDQRLKHPLTYEHMRMSGMGTSGIFSRSSISGTPIRIHNSKLH